MNAIFLINLFDNLFSTSHNTRLVGGGEEPEYRPVSTEYAYHRIIFTRDYASSALHEIAHWCVAGPVRRQQLDYGYWYIPDGRNPQQQASFEQVEIQPQALEWIFSAACGIKFRVSVDNLDGGSGNDGGPSLLFKQRLIEQVHQYCVQGLNERAEKWLIALLMLGYASPQMISGDSHSSSSHSCIDHHPRHYYNIETLCDEPFAINTAAFSLSSLL